jgi:secretion/DNA translocation related CpaE-like protein
LKIDPARRRNADTFPGMVNSTGGPARPSTALIATADDLLLDDLLRLAAAAGVTPQVESDLTGVRRHWQAASLVLVGCDLAGQLARAQPVRRTGVIVVGNDLDDAGIYQSAVAIGADQVVVLPDEETVLSDRLADSADEDGAAGAAVILAVVPGCGGAGASTLAAALAICGTRRGLRAMLVDGDPLGGGIDLLLGGEHGAGVRWPQLAGTTGRISAGALRSALPVVDDLAVLSWDRDDVVTVPPETMRSVLCAAQRSSDLVVVDVPRYGGEAADEVLARATSTVLVVPHDVRSCAAAARVAGRLALAGNDVRVVVRESVAGSLKAADVAAHLGAPLVAELRLDKDLARQVENGRFAPHPRSPLGRTCAALLDRFGLYGRDAA